MADEKVLGDVIKDLNITPADVIRILKMVYTNCNVHAWLKKWVDETGTSVDNSLMVVLDKITGFDIDDCKE